MARHLNYYDISLDDRWTCECGCTFRIGDEFETYDALYDVHCPGCRRMVLIVSFPTPGETRKAAEAGNPRAIADLPQAEQIERRWRRGEELELQSAEQLPEVGAEEIVFEFDLVQDDEPEREHWFTISHEGREIWRELAFYKGAPRYGELKALLTERYGPALEIRVTDQAMDWLLGDKYRSLPA